MTLNRIEEAMKIARFEANRQVHYGIVEGDVVTQIEGDIFGDFSPTEKTHALDAVKLLAPVTPTQMFGPGVNFEAHLAMASAITGNAEMLPTPEPWRKAINSLSDPDAPIVIPYDSKVGVEYEGECIAIIGATTRRIDPDEAWNRILGYTCGNDVSERDWQVNDYSMWRAKGTDTFGPIGPWIETDFDPRAGGDMIVRVDGNEVERVTTADMYYDFGALVSFISQHVTLKPGDAIWSGTSGHPETLHAGQIVEIEVTGIGVLSNPVVAEQESD